MASFTDLPKDLITEIVVKVANTSFADLVRVKTVSRSCNEITQTDGFFKKVNLLFMHYPWKHRDVVSDFKNRCLDHENPSALFLFGAAEFFKFGKTGEGYAIILKAAKLGSSMRAQYCSTMLDLLAIANIKKNNHIFDELSLPLDVAIKHREDIEMWWPKHWGYPATQEFLDRQETLFSLDFEDTCSCLYKESYWCSGLCLASSPPCKTFS
ncbi:hypothetical protein EUTSA_v10002858mg [Eutrema salsugineum]|uniref:At2g35280-like TPR domain-containing protein n=1 Tax=Eutrema salsugineum TaxID=72664 RepID=V4KID9_EUTSA|nr:hypothetical protein EUTSA_v10002858mg [Eutrema salsugineum]